MSGMEDSTHLIIKIPSYLKSDNIIEPDACLRPTQSNIGFMFSKPSSDIDERYGVHKNEYSGIGNLKLLNSRGEAVQVPRTHYHLKTGLHREIQAPTSKKSMVNVVRANEGLFANNIGKVGPELFKLSRSTVSKPLPKLAGKQLFPRSIAFELDFTKAVNEKAILEALEKERELFEKAFQEKKEKAAGIRREKDVHVREMRLEPSTSVELEKQTKTEGTLDTKPHTAEVNKCTSVCGPCGCVMTHGVCPKCTVTGPSALNIKEQVEQGWLKTCKKWPSEEPKYGSPWGEQRKAEMLRVGYPFAQEAASWLYCTNKPFDCQKLYRPSLRKFPERSFSSINI